ncbi:MAG: DNA polymerase III subunit epsilon [Rhizobiales bacterium]|nr:DNA polymerase III subunit epsilon [Hyphomicrobiales bacterium]
MREIVIDTETTGLDPYLGHRLVEIGCVELVNRIPSGQVFHRYVNPERDIPAEAFAVHGIDGERVRNERIFAEIVDELAEFLGDAPLVAHNAMFDLGFLNAEMQRCGKPEVARERMIDTLLLARRRYPGGANRLDDLCARYRIDNSRRTKHGALLDAELLAEVYVELIDARQASLVLVEASGGGEARRGLAAIRQRPEPLPPRLTASECDAHLAFVGTLGGDAIWNLYLTLPTAGEMNPAPRTA